MSIEPLFFRLNPWVDRARLAPGTRRYLAWYDDALILFLGCRCNLRCLYCFAPKDLADAFSLEDLDVQLQVAARSGLHRVVLTGGEPLLYPDLDALLALLKKRGFAEFGIQTNGIRLKDSTRLARLVEVGLRFCHLSFDSPEAATQDRLAGRDAPVHRDVLSALENLGRHPEVTLSVKAVITSLNQRQMPAHVALLARLKRDFGISPMLTLTPMLPPSPRYDPLLVRYRVVAPLVMEAIGLGQQAGILTWAHHLPYCCLGGEMESSADYYTQDLFLGPQGETSAGTLYRKGRQCEDCSLVSYCPGFSRNYAVLFGEEEFRPIGKSPPAVPRSDRRIAARRVSGGGARVILGAHRPSAPEYFHWDRATSALGNALEAGHRRIILTGPEPVLHPALLEIVGTYARAGLEVWIETVGFGLQREAPLRALLRSGVRGLRWLHLPQDAAVYRRYLREVSLSHFLSCTAQVIDRSRITVEHVILTGNEPLPRTVARVSALRALLTGGRPSARFVTSHLPLQEAWAAWLGMAEVSSGAADLSETLGSVPPWESPEQFRVFNDER